MKKIVFFLSLASLCLTGCTAQNAAPQPAQTVTWSSSTAPVVKILPAATSTEAKQVRATSAATTTVKSSSNPQSSTWPGQVNLVVPFASQAPFADWQPLYNEACEEASMIMAAYYFRQQALTKELMNQEILQVVAWESQQGLGFDLTAEQTVKVLREYFSLEAKTVKVVTAELIKQELARGNLVLLPAAGRELGNPYFRRPGPLYHMLIVRGYNANEQFITNDPGTKHGEQYLYSVKKLLAAVHDWNGGEVATGQPVLIVVSGKQNIDKE